MSYYQYRDSEKSIRNSAEDYSTLADYQNSFNSAMKQTPFISRLAIVPGSDKYINKILFDKNYYQPINKTQTTDGNYAIYPKID